MSKELRIEALGVQVALRGDDALSPEQWATLTSPWVDAELSPADAPAATSADASAPAQVSLTVGLREFPHPTTTTQSPSPSLDVSGSNLASLAQSITVRVTHRALAERRGEFLLLHAGGVFLPDGSTLAFVGPSGRGKTTAISHLTEHYGYVSDETVGVDPQLQVWPYRKPLSVILPDAATNTPKQQIAVSALHPQRAQDRELTTPLKLSRLVLLDRLSESELSEPQVLTVPLTEAITELLPQTSYLRDTPRALQFVAQIICATGGVLRVRYSKAESLAQVVPELLTHAGVADEWAPFPVPQFAPQTPKVSDATGTTKPPPGHYVGVSADDAITVGDDVLTFNSGTVRLLSNLGSYLWQQTATARTLDELVAATVGEFGEPPQGSARELVLAGLTELISAGLILSGGE